jgi:hypothetical protein
MTKDELEAIVDSDAVREAVNRWLAAGKGVAVYENHDLGHPEVGHKQFLSYGAPEAQFEDEPPQRLPDFPTQINWRYELIGTYRGDLIEP